MGMDILTMADSAYCWFLNPGLSGMLGMLWVPKSVNSSGYLVDLAALFCLISKSNGLIGLHC